MAIVLETKNKIGSFEMTLSNEKLIPVQCRKLSSWVTGHRDGQVPNVKESQNEDQSCGIIWESSSNCMLIHGLSEASGTKRM